MRVFARERQARVLEELHRHGRVEVAALARALDVSEDTVRRDLRALAEAGHLQKTHGGAVVLDPARMAWAARADVAATAKDTIAAAAAALVEPGQTVFLDAGSTVMALAAALRVRPLTVVTNSLDIAVLLDPDDEVALTVTGGQWDRRSRFFCGPQAVATVSRHRADWAFLGACALHPDVGATSVSSVDAELKTAMAGAALRSAVLADRTKHDTVAPHLVLSPDAIDVLVTDDPTATGRWRRHAVAVIDAQDPGAQGRVS